MQVYFATFGAAHEYSGAYVEIHAIDHHFARSFMIKAHGDRWAELYGPAEFRGMPERHELHKLATVIQKVGYNHKDGTPIFRLDWRAQ